MSGFRRTPAALMAAALVAVCTASGFAQTTSGADQGSAPRLPLAPLGRVGNAITPAQEGWWKNADGTVTFLLGYFNRNEGTVEIPIGPDNRIEPGGPDMGQPTVFMRGRQHGMFTVTVPKDFGTRRLTWTLVANGKPTTISLWINQPYVVDPLRNAATGNTPPRVRFEPNGPAHVAGPRGIAASYTTTVNTPLSMTVWIKDVGDEHHVDEGPSRNPPLRVSWSKYRGPGTVTFEPPSHSLQQLEGESTVKATFSAPGEYRLRAQINDASGEGGGGDQCCWTSAHVTVIVK